MLAAGDRRVGRGSLQAETARQPPTSAELETVQTLRDAYRDGRSVRLAARDSVFFEDRRVITAVREGLSVALPDESR